MILLSWERPPRLNQAFDSERSSGASVWNNPITRRSFLKRSGAATVGAIVLSATLTKRAEAYDFNINIGSLNIEYSEAVSGETPITDTPETAKYYRMRCVEPNNGHQIGGLEDNDLKAEHAGFKEITRNNVKHWYRIYLQCVVIAGKIADEGWYNEITVAFVVKARWCAVKCDGDNDFSKNAPGNNSTGDGYGYWSNWRKLTRRSWVLCDQVKGDITSGPMQEATQDTFNEDGSSITTSLDIGGARITCKGKFSIHGLSSDEENVFNEFQQKEFTE